MLSIFKMTTNAITTWQTTAWPSNNSEENEEADDPPESRSEDSSSRHFHKAPVQSPCEATSLLTKAIMGGHEQDTNHRGSSLGFEARRRSMASNISIASTADLTSDTGLTSPARSNTPSPPIPETMVSRLAPSNMEPKAGQLLGGATLHPQMQGSRPDPAPRKRSIQFACAGKPANQNIPRPPATTAPSAQEIPRRPCIRFACSARPSTTQNTPPKQMGKMPESKVELDSPSTPRRIPVPATDSSVTPRQHARKHSVKSSSRPKFLRANSTDLGTDGSQFHEFASANAREHDWIRQEAGPTKGKLTVDDLLIKENRIRRLAMEAEEEAELEDEDDEAVIDEDDEDEDEDDDDDDECDDEDEDDEDDEGSGDEDEEEDDFDDSDGYHTDEETGFAESDDSDVEGDDDNMVMWTLSNKSPAALPQANTPTMMRRPSLHEQHSDSSATSHTSARRIRQQRVVPQSDTTDLPDSTDFVCGTLDEDRPLEEAYLESLAARRKDKLRIIPQDIDPSFPTSEPENEDDEDMFNPVHHSSDDENTWMPAKMDDLHHGQDRGRGKRKSAQNSPRRIHSPAPRQRLASPPPKPRCRSPKPLFNRQSPRRARSPAPRGLTTPLGSPRNGNNVTFNLAARPGINATKSLPRPGAMFFLKQQGRLPKLQQEDDIHVRGAIDIVKGLEKKRQRRKEKFHQKYCNRARRGQIPERKAQPPGRGAERMKELGLLMAGKKDQGNYVLSV